MRGFDTTRRRLGLLGLACLLLGPELAQAQVPMPAAILSCARAANRTSTLAIQDKTSGGWRLTSKSSIATAADGTWTIDCGPSPTETGTATAELHRLCTIDAAVIDCLRQRFQWRLGTGDTAGLMFPPQ
jgi:hypothetical protein